jgi:hypothetical protein
MSRERREGNSRRADMTRSVGAGNTRAEESGRASSGMEAGMHTWETWEDVGQTTHGQHRGHAKYHTHTREWQRTMAEQRGEGERGGHGEVWPREQSEAGQRPLTGHNRAEGAPQDT